MVFHCNAFMVFIKLLRVKWNKHWMRRLWMTQRCQRHRLIHIQCQCARIFLRLLIESLWCTQIFVWIPKYSASVDEWEAPQLRRSSFLSFLWIQFSPFNFAVATFSCAFLHFINIFVLCSVFKDRLSHACIISQLFRCEKTLRKTKDQIQCDIMKNPERSNLMKLKWMQWKG